MLNRREERIRSSMSQERYQRFQQFYQVREGTDDFSACRLEWGLIGHWNYLRI